MDAVDVLVVHLSKIRFLEGKLYQEREEEAAQLQSSAGKDTSAEDLLPIRWLFCRGSPLRQV